MLTLFFFLFVVALTGSLAFPFAPYYGGKEVLQTTKKNTITSLRLKFSLIRIIKVKCVYFVSLYRAMHIYLLILASHVCSMITSTIGEARFMTRLSNWYVLFTSINLSDEVVFFNLF